MYKVCVCVCVVMHFAYVNFHGISSWNYQQYSVTEIVVVELTMINQMFKITNFPLIILIECVFEQNPKCVGISSDKKKTTTKKQTVNALLWVHTCSLHLSSNWHFSLDGRTFNCIRFNEEQNASGFNTIQILVRFQGPNEFVSVQTGVRAKWKTRRRKKQHLFQLSKKAENNGIDEEERKKLVQLNSNRCPIRNVIKEPTERRQIKHQGNEKERERAREREGKRRKNTNTHAHRQRVDFILLCVVCIEYYFFVLSSIYMSVSAWV